MATFVLFWNPAISSFKMEDYRRFFSARPEAYGFNWSIWEHDKACDGDRFVMVRCKNKPIPGKLNQWGKQLWEPIMDSTTGIFMTGYINSEPWEGEDWSGKGRQTFYVDLDIEHMSDPEECVILSAEELTTALPGFTWVGGHSGRLLDNATAGKLDEMIKSAVEAKREQIWTPKRFL